METSMRILMLTQFYPPLLGGIELHVKNLSCELVQRGHDVAVVTIRHKGQPAFEVSEGVRVYRICSSVQRLPWLFSSSGRQYPPPIPDPELMLELREIILKEHPEIVHAHNWLARSFYPLKVWSKARLVVSFHNYSRTCAKVNYLYNSQPCTGPGLAKCFSCVNRHYGVRRGTPTTLGNWLMNPIEKHTVDMFLPVSNAVAVGNRLKRSHLPFRVIPNFIADDPETLQVDPEPYLAQLPEGDFLLFAGGLARVKGVETLLNAYARLKNMPPLVLIGYETRDWKELPGYHLPNVIVLKDWPHHAVMAAWSRCMLGLAPSIFPDPCPTVAMEAMSMGKALIGTRVGGLPDLVIDGETGLLVPPGNPQALSEAIQTLVDDPIRRACMREHALQHVENFRIKSVVPRIEQVYRELLHT